MTYFPPPSSSFKNLTVVSVPQALEKASKLEAENQSAEQVGVTAHVPEEI